MSEVRKTKITESELRQRVAVHEASHAVVGLDQGLDVRAVSIVPYKGERLRNPKSPKRKENALE